MTPPLDDSTVLITGASAGIGREIARLLGPRAQHVILVARRVDRLAALSDELDRGDYGPTVHVMPCDLSDADAVDGLAMDVLDTVGDVDVLVNNAGFGHQSAYVDAERQAIRDMIQVNVAAVMQLTRHFLPAMIKKGRGGILNIGSGAGFVPLPRAAVYSGTKHFVHGFTESLRLDVLNTGVVVTEVCPGPVKTEFHDVAGADDPTEDEQFGALTISARQCAEESVAGFTAGEEIVFPGAAYRAVMAAQSLLPRPIQRWLFRRLRNSMT